jgi:tetrahydromethanopterin S-methyltransferase subunit G
MLMLLLGALTTAFFTLIGKRLDSIDRKVEVIEGDLRQFYSVTGELKGRMDARH